MKTHLRNGNLNYFHRIQNWAMVRPRIDSSGILKIGTLDSPLKPIGHVPAYAMTKSSFPLKKSTFSTSQLI